ncbi:ACP S-malonyltransferase [Thiococcus pfennigii]|jgi:[acyl-carrier-protein] S-malonyltransferase|uniref:ACP S-malonyltransferase n=1 Tax=Thiococcus pfennigii TaxID=1057 RepID=UPI0019036F49|nr:ACP S-malonyltransferase [Thiococcus pfennigii]MBK1700443.1 [acyl-carrier-protein] S-malonyltransferase [Thiococcus pfennigii]MBK1731300.1 [acyl-carrier-protein] S-malonyltransferase [Thiococcus pfennigii]
MSAALAFLFPGQGSQAVGMLRDLAQAHPLVGETFAEASEVLGRDLWRLVDEGPKEELDRTENTQPAMLAAGVAVWRVWQAAGGPEPQAVAGHSLGEYGALVAAGALSFVDAVAVVAERGRLMQAAVPPGAGAMAAIIGAADADVVALCEAQAQGEVLEAVNFNAPGQVVIAGARAAVERASEAAKDAGAKGVVALPVSVPAHSSLMRPAAERLAERLAGVALAAPQIPILHNASVAPEPDPVRMRELLVRQLYSPVRWVETVQRLAGEGAGLAIECGPGRVLTGLGKRIDKRFKTLPVFDPDTLATALEAANAA